MIPPSHERYLGRGFAPECAPQAEHVPGSLVAEIVGYHNELSEVSNVSMPEPGYKRVELEGRVEQGVDTPPLLRLPRHLAWVTTTVFSRSSTRALLHTTTGMAISATSIALRSLSAINSTGVIYLTRLDTCHTAWTSTAQCSYAAELIAGTSTL